MSINSPNGFVIMLVPTSQLNGQGQITTGQQISTGINNTFLPSTVTYSPNQEFDETFAFAENTIASWDTSQNGTLDLYEMTRMLNGNFNQAAQLLNTVDNDADFEVNAVEVAADLLYADNAASTLASTINAYLPQMTNPQMKTLYQNIATNLTNFFPSQLDGRITSQEENIAFQSIQSPVVSFFARQSIDGIINTAITDCNGVTATLNERYQTYLDGL